MNYRYLDSDDLRAVGTALGCTQAQMAASLEVGERTWRRYVSGTYETPRGIHYACFWLLQQAGANGNQAAIELLLSFRGAEA